MFTHPFWLLFQISIQHKLRNEYQRRPLPQNTTQLNKLTKEEGISKRENLKRLLDGYIFHPISTWPSSIREIVEHDTIVGKNTFKLILFACGNGISPNVLVEYLYTLILNTPSKIRKRTHQLQWIITNINVHQHKWYYFDMYHRSFLLFDGLKKNQSLHIQI